MANYTPGTSQDVTVDPSVHTTLPDDSGTRPANPVSSVTKDPFPPIEFGRTDLSTGGIASVTVINAGTGLTPGGPTVRTVTNISGSGSNGGLGVTVGAGGSVTTVTVAAAGTGYSPGDRLSVNGLTGVVVEVSTLA